MNPLDKLGRIDLNLLVSLYVLLDERNVTRAAQRLFITQPAASRTLTRLRKLFDDPLLTRSGSEMVTTPLAQQLQSRLPVVLEQVQELVAPSAFDPATETRAFRLAVPNAFAHALVGPLLGETLNEAPGVQICFSAPHAGTADAMAAGDIDFALNRETEFGSNPAIIATPLANVGGIVVARRDHPLAGKSRIGVSQLLAYPWADCFPGTDARTPAPVDQHLQAQGLQRRIVFHSPDLFSALQVLRHSDCLLFIAGHLRHSAQLADFALLDMPGKLRLADVQLAVFRHRRTTGSAAHDWLMNKLVRLSGQLFPSRASS